MPRPKEVSRTFKVLICEVLCVDVNSHETFTQVEEIPFMRKEEKILSAIRENIETDDVKVATILNRTVAEYLYTMPESTFISMATKNPPRGTKTETENPEENATPTTEPIA